MIARRLRIRGKVQGVFYRKWAVSEAMAQGIAGWVRNRADGSVEVLAIGGQGAVGRFAAACREGPPGARVEAVDVEPAEAATLTGFTEEPTA